MASDAVLQSLLQSDAVAAFGVFARHRNFTRAAAELHIAQPSLHVKIRKLASALGATLYERVGRELVLTEAGEKVAAFARDAEQRADELLTGLGTSSRRVSIAAGRAALLWVLGDSLRRAVGAGVDLRIIPADRDNALRAVRIGEADVAAFAHDPPPQDLDRIVLAEHPQNLLVAPTDPLAKRRTVRLDDLDGRRLVVPPSGRPHRQSLERALSSRGITWSPAAEADGWDLLVHLASIGMGAAVVNGCVPCPSQLVAVPVADLPRVTYWLAWRRERAGSVALILDRADHDG
jgi:DNA-binding transcriptional LysR family regulator